MLHYHGAEVTPRAELLRLAGRCFCVSFAYPRTVEVAHEIGQSVLLDNGAYSFYQSKKPVQWEAYLEWCEEWLRFHTTWAIIPDVVGGTEAENDELLDWWHGRAGHLDAGRTAPVWHVHQSTERLVRLCGEYDKVCVGSSVGRYRTVGGKAWRERMTEAMNVLCGDGPPPAWLHLLKGMGMRGSEFPFASVDSAMIALEHNRQVGRRGYRYDVVQMAREIDAVQCPAVWRVSQVGPGHKLPGMPWGDDTADRTKHKTNQIAMEEL